MLALSLSRLKTALRAAEPLAIRPSDDTELMLRQLREQGLCVMRGVIPADRIPAVRDAVRFLLRVFSPQAPR